MTVPQWAPGTLYQPGDVVQRRSALPVVQDAPTNGSFESGGTGWTFDGNWGVSPGVPGIIPAGFNGANSLVLNGAFIGVSYATNDNLVPVRPGQVINASCYVNCTGQLNTGRQAGSCSIFWFDEDEQLLLISEGTQQLVTFFNWVQSTVTGTAPSGAAFAYIGCRGQRNTDAYAICFDAFTWDYTFSEPADGLVFKATQANAGYSAVTEPVWPTVAGNTVVDNEVTWEAFLSASLTWQAHSILVSGATEPDWPDSMNAAVVDNTISWVATTGQVTDEKCPNTTPVAIAASKIFAGNIDIISYSATINPLDWSSRNDAGYLPFGLQTYGSTPVTALGLYRGNLVAFNAQSFQMWQVDQDPANMALLDAVPVGCVYPRSVQPLMNDLLFLSRVGVRGITIAGASTNLQADGIGDPVDSLIAVEVKARTYEPIAVNYPAGGQYWLLFGPQAFVCTVNGAKDRSWSRYQFPYAITDWTIHNNDLYLRAGDLVWKFDEDQVDDDVVDPEVVFTLGPVATPLAMAFDAEPDYLSVGGAGALSYITTNGDGSFTLTGWAKHATGSGDEIAFLITEGDLHFVIVARFGGLFGINTGGLDDPVPCTEQPPDDEWFFFALRADQSSNLVDLYWLAADQNTLVDAQGALDVDYANIVDGPTEMSAGGTSVGLNWNGSLTQIRVWTALLNDSQIIAEKQSSSLVHTTNAVVAAPMQGAVDLSDESGNGFTSTAHGTITTVAGPLVQE